MHEFTDLLKVSTKQIAPLYFHIELDGGDPVCRERVYCYELYHQLRCLWPADTQYCLNGELDKAAHPILKKLGADFAKPDLLVHQPGHMAGNKIIIEVKSSNAKRSGIEDDLRKLSLFRTKVGYERAIYLLYGYEVDKAAKLVRLVAESFAGLSPIELWLHAYPGEAATPSLPFQPPTLDGG